MERITKLLNLNKEQTMIAGSRARRIAVSAGAGTGKTRLLVARYLAELESGVSDIPSIVSITFTENAAAELRERIGASIGLYIREFGGRGNLNEAAPGKLSNAPICTIHGLAARIVRENLFDTNFPPGFEITDRSEADALLNKSVLEAVLKLRATKSPASEALAALLEYESFNLDTVLKNIALIIRGSCEKHLPRPLRCPEIKGGRSTESVGKLLLEKGGVFSSTSARKRFKDALRLADVSVSAPAPIACRNLKDTVEALEKIKKMKSAKESEKIAAEEIRVCASEAADLLNAQLTDRYLLVADEAAERLMEMKIQNSVIDYEDLLTNALKVLETNRDALRRYRKQFGLIMVDEFQDTDSLQNKIIELLHGGETGKLIIVGDKMQSIYGFRGAEPELFNNALNSPEFEKFHLSTNYRTSSQLTAFTNGFFENIFDDYKPMNAAREGAGAFETFPAEGENAGEKRENEAARIAEKISELAETGAYSYGDIALIFRKGTNIKIYEQALRRAKLPFRRIGETAFFGLTEIRDLVSMMRFIHNPLDKTAEAAVLRSPFFGISDTGLARYFSEKRKTKAGRSYRDFLRSLLKAGDGEPSLAARHLLSVIEEKEKINASSPLAVAQLAAYSMGYAAGALALPNGRQIRSNIIKFVEICGQLSEKGTGLAEAVSHFDARKKDRSESAGAYETDDSVTLLTCHASKGLEFPVVFLADTDYSAAPDKNNIAISSKLGVMVCHDQCGFGTWKEIAEEGTPEEEKRILYVAMTRAGDVIFTQKHAKPRRSSLAGIMENGLEKLPGFKGKAGEMPPVKGEGKNSPAGAVAEKSWREVTGANLRPVFERENNGEPCHKFRSVARNEEGEIIHRFFEIWDFSPDSIEISADFAVAERFVSSQSVREKIVLCARNALKSPLADMVRKARARHREYEFTLETEGENGREVRGGKIDLLLESERGIVIVDYKYTDFFTAEKYAEQIEFYDRAVEKNYGEKPVERYICVLPDADMKEV